MKRRDLLKGMVALPITGGFIPKMAAGESNNSLVEKIRKAGEIQSEVKSGVENMMGSDAGFRIPSVVNMGKELLHSGSNDAESGDVFRSIGVEPLINCMGTYTIIGGSIERESVRTAMGSAAHSFIQYDELAEGVGRRLAELTGAEWGIVSSGCASCIKQATVACITGGDPEKLVRVPYLNGLEKTEVIIPRHSRNLYDHAVRNAGVKVITVENLDELERALNPRTAMIYITTSKASATGQPFSLENIARVAKPHNVPILVDAAAEDLTVPIVHFSRGATMVTYSGGKAICGPQCSGLLFGPKPLMQSAWHAAAPHHGPGRDNKVGREEMIGALAAVEAWVKFDHKGQWQEWLGYLDTVSKGVTKVKGVTTEVIDPKDLNNNTPILFVSWNPKELHITGEEVAEEVGRNKPRIALAFRDDPNSGTAAIRITSGQMQPGEDKVVADRLYKLLSQKRNPKPEKMEGAAVNLTGWWDVEVQFYSSKSNYRWFLEQEGNWINGTQQGELSNWDLFGSVEGNKFKLQGRAPLIGDNVSFTYSGEASENSFSGSIYMIEYGTAKFNAKRSEKNFRKRPINIPGGPPLAT